MLSENWLETVEAKFDDAAIAIIREDLAKSVSFIKFLKSLDTTILTQNLPFPLPVAFKADQKEMFGAMCSMGNGFLDITVPRQIGATTVVRKYLYDALYYRQDYKIFYNSILAHGQAIMRSFFAKELIVRPYSIINPSTGSSVRWGIATRGVRADKLIMDNTFSGEEDLFSVSNKVVSINSSNYFPEMRIVFK